jgi:hypothetical protein
MQETVKLAAAAIVIKKAAPDWLNRIIGRPTQAMMRRNKAFKLLFPALAVLGLGGAAYQYRDKLKNTYDDVSQKVRSLIDREPEIQTFLNDTGDRGAAILQDVESAARLSASQFQDLLRNLQGRTQ